MSLAFMENYARIRKQLYAPAQKPIVIAPKPKPEPVVRDIIQLNSVIIPDYKGDPKFSFALAYMPPGGNWHEQERARWVERNGMEMRKSARHIISEVAKQYGVSVLDIVSARRQADIIIPRHYAMWRIRNETLLSHPSIGRIFHRDHTVSVYACRKIGALIADGKFNAPA